MRRPFLALTTALVLPLACSAGGQAPPAGVVIGTILYDGAWADAGKPLAIAVYDRFPPSGPPRAFRIVERPALPYEYMFEELAPGRYYVGALLDVDSADTRMRGMLNPLRDPHGYFGGGQPVPLTAYQGAAGVDVILTDAR